MTHIFLAAPYKSFPGSLDDAWEASCKAAIPFKRARVPLYNPLSWHPVAMQGVLDPHDPSWGEMNLPFLTTACALVVVKIAGWDRSAGIAAERNTAENHQIPVYEALPGEVPLALIRQIGLQERQAAEAAERLTQTAVPNDNLPDVIAQPKHYIATTGIEAIDVIDAFVADPASHYHANILKYATRWRAKNGVEDLRKLRRYTDRLINFLSTGERKW